MGQRLQVAENKNLGQKMCVRCAWGFFYVLTAVPKLGGLREGGRGSTTVSPASVSVHAHAGPWADLETLQLKNVL